MLTKVVGGTGYYQLTSSTGTMNVSTALYGTQYGQLNQNLVPNKVRIAVTRDTVINFGLNAADNNSDVLMPAGHVEHFKLDATNTVTYVLVTGQSLGGFISITPVA